MEKMLAYYGFKTIEEFGKQYGFNQKVDAERFLVEKYEEDIIWEE